MTVILLSREKCESIHHNALRILGEVGVCVENDKILDILAQAGGEVDKENSRVRFPKKLLEDFLTTSSSEFDNIEGLEVSCLFPDGERKARSGGIECCAGTYPQYFLTLNGEIIPHTQRTVADMTRLADYLSHLDRLGCMGIPSDVPPLLSPLYMKFIAWKYAEKKLSNCGEIRDSRLIPYIVEMGEVMAEHRRVSSRRYVFGEVEMIAPLRFSKVEAEIFVSLWERGYLCGVGSMYSAGGSGPVTLAGTVSLMVAESLFIALLYRYFYGIKKLHLQCNSSILDMKEGMFPFGRPERALMTLAMGDMARFYNASLWAGSVYPDAKYPGLEAGLQASFGVIPALLAGSLSLESFGLLSGAEMGSPVQLVIDNEFADALKRFVRGMEVSEDTLCFELIKDVGCGGTFMDTLHTLENFRKEHWQPEIFSRQSLNSWRSKGERKEVDKSKEICRYVWENYHPRGFDETTESKLLQVMERAKLHLL